MTDKTMPSTPSGLHALFDIWKVCVQDVLSQISGQPNTFETVFEPLAGTDSDLCYTTVASGAVQGEMQLRLGTPSALRLASKFLGEPETPSEKDAGTISDEKREALDELLRQVGGLAATGIVTAAGGQVQFQFVRGEASWSRNCDQIATLRTRDEAEVEIALEIRLSPALVTSMESRTSLGQPRVPSAASSAPAAGLSVEQGPIGSPSDGPSAFERLHGVELGVKLRFGTRSMLLRDVLALSSGLVVELDNKLNSPVDLLLDGRVIARGEVVVIDGKYGLQITDIPDPAGALPV
jgi:flagellar motor switch protein FliN